MPELGVQIRATSCATLRLKNVTYLRNTGSQARSVGAMTVYGLDRRGSIPGRSKRLFSTL